MSFPFLCSLCLSYLATTTCTFVSLLLLRVENIWKYSQCSYPAVFPVCSNTVIPGNITFSLCLCSSFLLRHPSHYVPHGKNVAKNNIFLASNFQVQFLTKINANNGMWNAHKFSHKNGYMQINIFKWRKWIKWHAQNTTPQLHRQRSDKEVELYLKHLPITLHH